MTCNHSNQVLHAFNAFCKDIKIRIFKVSDAKKEFVLNFVNISSDKSFKIIPSYKKILHFYLIKFLRLSIIPSKTRFSSSRFLWFWLLANVEISRCEKPSVLHVSVLV